MVEKCPGQETRNLGVSVHKCQKCGNEVEIFSDEEKARCRKCGEVVHRVKTSSPSHK